LFVVKQTMMKILLVMLFVIVTRLKNVNVFNARRCVILLCDDFVIAMFFFDLLYDKFLISMWISLVLSLCELTCKEFA
jgi:hypothetical protein